jgi:hypothetical protein
MENLTSISLAIGLLLGGLSHLPPAIAKDMPTKVESQDVVRWEPLARVDLGKPFTIEMKNSTSERLEYLITTHTNFRSIAPGETVKLSSLTLPLFLNINATRTVGVKYLLSVERNTVKVELRLTGGQGDTTLNIDDKGAIYLY